MPRFFIELTYRGTNYAGFQIQQNALTIQQEVENAMKIYFRRQPELTGSSRTDAGVHAMQNYFHFDLEGLEEQEVTSSVYHLNAILPDDIAINRIYRVGDEAHCRFDAVWRLYHYTIYRKKNPFLDDRAFYFPYKIDWDIMRQAAGMIRQTTDFESFSKKKVQVSHFRCEILESGWWEEGDMWVYKVRGNRFLRGMVRGLTGTMLRVGTGKLSLEEFRSIIESKDPTRVDFSVPARGLTLMEVGY